MIRSLTLDYNEEDSWTRSITAEGGMCFLFGVDFYTDEDVFYKTYTNFLKGYIRFCFEV